MAGKTERFIPKYVDLIEPTYKILCGLGGSGTNYEILTHIISELGLIDEIVDYPHLGSNNQSELQFRLAWARTYLKNYVAIQNSTRSVRSVTPAIVGIDSVDGKNVVAHFKHIHSKRNSTSTDYILSESQLPGDTPPNDEIEFPDEIKPWRTKLAEILNNMDPFSFERLSQRLLRKCGFTQVDVTKKPVDGGIDGIGKLLINGIFSFNVAFQCNRYKGLVSSRDIRNFRGSLTADIEKGVLITTGTLPKAACDEASMPGKPLIDLIDGEEFITKLVKNSIGVKTITSYDIDEEYLKRYDVHFKLLNCFQ